MPQSTAIAKAVRPAVVAAVAAIALIGGPARANAEPDTSRVESVAQALPDVGIGRTAVGINWPGRINSANWFTTLGRVTGWWPTLHFLRVVADPELSILE
ncbi:hypothetical protein ACRAKI_06025 [Saccharothrix isguenensis]